MFDLQRSEPLEQALQRAARPLMEKLAGSSKETVNLGILDAGEVVVISTVESQQSVRMSSKIGNRRLLHSTALGKVLLAGMPDKEAQRLLRIKGIRRLTAQTLTTKPALMAEIRKIQKQEWALDNQEMRYRAAASGRRSRARMDMS